MSPRSKAAREQARTEATQEVLVELHTLRHTVEVMNERYRIRVSGQLAELIRAMEGDPSLDQPARLLTLKAAQAALERIQAAELKPKRGRSKDFARLEELVAELTELVPPER